MVKIYDFFIFFGGNRIIEQKALFRTEFLIWTLDLRVHWGGDGG